MKIAYCDCFSGISGDMFLGALLDAGLSLDHLRSELSKLPIAGEFELEVYQSSQSVPAATKLDVILKGHADSHPRNFDQIAGMIHTSGLSDRVKEVSVAIFGKLAHAEASVHGEPVDTVHFHEVGAVDAIVDIVGAAIGLEALGIEALYASSLPYGEGQVQSAHGILPLPAPATLALLAECHAPLRSLPASFELVTPTGAAILATLAKFERPNIVLQRIGAGAGRKKLPWPNILRIWLGEVEATDGRRMVVLETNIDNMNPEFFGHVMTRLFAAGARDVWMTPIYMKKNRPATMLSVLALEQDQAQVAEMMIRETSTLGVRVYPVWRFEAGRRMESVFTEYGEIPVKLKLLDGEALSAAPEYEACLRVAQELGLPLAQVYSAAQQAGYRLIEKIQAGEA